MEEEGEHQSSNDWGQSAKEMESMFKESIEAMNERFHQDRPMREGNKATNDSLESP